MTTPEALFGVVPFGRVDFGEARQGRAGRGQARRGLAWNLDGQGSARLGTAGARHGIWRGIAGRGVARLGTSEARNMARRGKAWHGQAGHEQGLEYGPAGHAQGAAGHAHGKEHGRAHPQEQQTNNNNMDSESLHSNALMNYAGLLYSAYMREARARHNITTPTWADFVCDPLNKVSVFCWVEVARVALKIETEVRDAQL